MENSTSKVKIIGALLAGVVAGVTLGILFAPEKGSRTRRKLVTGAKGIANDFNEKIKEEARNLRQKAEDLESLVEDKMEEMVNSAREKATAALHHN